MTTLDYALHGLPFVVVPTGTANTPTLDFALGGVPFLAPVGTIVVAPTVTESVTATDSVTTAVTRVVAVTESTTATDSVSVTITRAVYVAEVVTATDSASTGIVHAEDVLSGAVSGMDFAYEGQPFFSAGADDTFGLDYVLAARPFIITTVPFTGAIQPSIKIYSSPQML